MFSITLVITGFGNQCIASCKLVSLLEECLYRAERARIRSGSMLFSFIETEQPVPGLSETPEDLIPYTARIVSTETWILLASLLA